jgi:hypothetical protein
VGAPHIHKIASGEIVVWINEGGAISIKTREPRNDPVELAEHEAVQLAELLYRLVRECRE